MTDHPVVLITGATDGLGQATAIDLARRGARVIVHGRDPERLATTAAEVADAAGADNPPATVLADLADLAEVRELPERVRAVTDRLDVLVNNAGIGSGEPDGRDRRESADGHELRLAVNYLAGFALTLGLLPMLRDAAPARVVMVASLGQSPLDLDDLMLTRSYDGWRAYGQSKLAQILFARELAERVPVDLLTANSVHPGTFMPTKMVLLERGRSDDSLETGVASVTRLVLDPALAGVSGRFFDRQREGHPDAQVEDAELRRALWERSLELTGVIDPTA